VGNVTHDENGKFAKGNSLGKGNPHAQRVAKLKAALLECETPDRVRNVMGKLYDLAMEGDVQACKEYLNRLFGKEVVATIEASTTDGGGIFVYLPGNKR